jgi:hypothetical protein
MKRKFGYFVLISAILSLTLTLFADANVIWPAVYVSARLYSAYIIIAGLVIEFLFIKFAAKQTFAKSTLISLVMNAVSAIIGCFALPIIGFVVEIILSVISTSTFHPTHWAVAYILGLAFNVLIEGAAIKLIFKMPFKENRLWLTVANAISVIICIVSMAIVSPY